MKCHAKVIGAYENESWEGNQIECENDMVKKCK